ncbi:MAG: GatB/YqeY domain-containing protein [Myxococcota bacterium]
MGIEQRLDDDLKAGMRAKEAHRVSCIRQVRSKIQEAVNAKGFKGKVDDALYQETISTYIKSLQKGIEELAAGGERGEALCTKYQAEIDYLKEFLPEMMGEDETRALVKKTVEELAVTDPKQAGHVMGAVMKDHQGKVDPGLVRRLVDEALAGSDASS